MKRKIIIFAVVVILIAVGIGTGIAQAKNNGTNLAPGVWYSTKMDFTLTVTDINDENPSTITPPSNNFIYKKEIDILYVKANPIKIAIYSLLPMSAPENNIYTSPAAIWEQAVPMVQKTINVLDTFEANGETYTDYWPAVVFDENGITSHSKVKLYNFIEAPLGSGNFVWRFVGYQTWHGTSDAFGKPVGPNP